VDRQYRSSLVEQDKGCEVLMNITEKDLEGLTDMQKLFIKILLEIKRKDNK